MLDYGFANYKRVTVLTKGDRLGQRVPVRLAWPMRWKLPWARA